jgi:hypothetical protein
MHEALSSCLRSRTFATPATIRQTFACPSMRWISAYTKEHINTFVVISGDSDFSPLASKLRESAKTAIGVGVKRSTSDLLMGNCDNSSSMTTWWRRASAPQNAGDITQKPKQRRPQDQVRTNAARGAEQGKELWGIPRLPDDFDHAIRRSVPLLQCLSRSGLRDWSSDGAHGALLDNFRRDAG